MSGQFNSKFITPKDIPWSSSTGETVVVIQRQHAGGIQSAQGWSWLKCDQFTVSKRRKVGAWFSPDGEACLQGLVEEFKGRGRLFGHGVSGSRNAP